MGFFKRELNKAIKRSVNKALKPKPQKQSRQRQAPQTILAVVQMRPWNYSQQAEIIELDGDYENVLFTYNTEPLKGVRKGQTITVDIYRGDATLYSKYSGNTATSEEFDDVVVMYNHEPIGFAALPRDKVIEAAQMGYAFRMKAKCYGMLEDYPGVKEMKLLAPKPFYLYGLIPGAPDDRPKRVVEAESDEYFSYNEYDTEDFKNIATKDKWVFFDAKIEIIPTPKGSKAKPHIGVYSSDGMLISEVAAKNSYYEKMLDYMNRYEAFTVKATRRASSVDDSAFYKIEIMGK